MYERVYGFNLVCGDRTPFNIFSSYDDHDVGPDVIGPNVIGPNVIGPNVIGPNVIDPNVIDPNVIDPNLFFF
jgi:hypothetical protein